MNNKLNFAYLLFAIAVIATTSAQEEATNNDDCDKCVSITSSIHQESQLTWTKNGQYRLCLRLTNAADRVECHHFIRDNAGALMGMYINEMTPIEMCQSLEKCRNQKSEENIDLFDGQTQIEDLLKLETAASIISRKVVQISIGYEKLGANKRIRRKVCKMMVKAIQKAIGNRPITDAVMKVAISAACTSTGPLLPVCNVMVGQIASKIIERMRKKQDPYAVCYRI